MQNEQLFDELMANIEQAVADAAQQEETAPRRYPHVVYPGRPFDIPYDPTLYHHLETALALAHAFPRRLELAPSRLDGWPLIGRIWGGLRRQAHSVALFYANRAARHQAEVNRHLLEAVGRLTAVVQQQQRQIAALQEPEA